MNKILTLFILIFLLNNQSIAQAIEWTKTFGCNTMDFMRSIQQTTDLGYIIGGSTHGYETADGISCPQNTNARITKIDQDGALEWSHFFGGTTGDGAYFVQQTMDQGYVFAGTSSSNDGDVGANNGQSDFWVVKLNEEGDLVWEENFGGSGMELASSIQQTMDQGYVIAGYSNSNDGDVGGNNGGKDIWVVKLDANGALIWERNFGGSTDEEASSIQQTSDQGYIIAGYSDSNDGDVGGNNGETDFWLIKLDVNGVLVWEKNFGGTSIEAASSIQQTTDQGYIVTGYTNSNDGDVEENNGQSDFWIIKLNEEGNLVWEKTFGGSDSEEATSIQQTMDQGYIIAGGSISTDGDVGGNYDGSFYTLDFWLVKLNEQGDLVWEKNFGGSEHDSARSIQQTADEGYVVVGYSKSDDGDVNENVGGKDAWVLKISPLMTSVNSIDLSLSSGFDIIPNPSNGNFLISIKDMPVNNPVTVRIFDPLGRTLFADIVSTPEINIKGIPKGNYFITLTSEDSTVSRKFIVH